MIYFQTKIQAGVGMEQCEFPLQVGLLPLICVGKKTLNSIF